LPPSPVGGRHTIAARIRNNRDAANIPNRMGFLFTMQEVDASGNVIEQPPIINSDEDWIVSDVAPGFRRAEVVTRVWSESNLYEYAATGLINLGFSITHDTDGNLWEDAPAEYTVDVGSSVLDALATFTEKDIDAAIDPDTLRLHMWNRRGTDKTGTVRLGLGRDGGNLIAHRVERVEPQYNTILMQLKDGRWVQRQTLAAVTANGREATGLSVGSTSDTGSANQVADAQLADLALPTVTFTSQVSSLTGPQMYVDYDLGDTINVPDEDGDRLATRRGSWRSRSTRRRRPGPVTPELMLDRSATPMVIDTGGPGTGDPGDVENPPGSGGGGGGGSTDPISGGGGTDVAYDWTALGYGTAYDAAGGAGGYIPDDTHAGVPAGSTYAQTMTPTGGMLTITASPAAKGVGTASASTNTVTLTGHGMPNGHPIYFSALSSDGSGLSAGVASWGVVANATSDTFQVKRLNEDTGLFTFAAIGRDYSSVTVMGGTWYDLVDFACYITVASSSTGLVLFTRCRHRGPATASATSASAAQGMIFNLSSAYVLGADQDIVPDAPVAKLDALYGKNYRVWRAKWRHVIDGLGSHGNNVLYGPYATGGAWFYPDPEHTNGTHCDLGMQVFGGDKHRIVGGHIEGLIDASVSTTSNPTSYPVPATTNSVLQVNHSAGLSAPTNILWDKVLLGGGGYTINVDGAETRPNLGRVNGRFKRNNTFHATSAIAAPSPGAKSGVVIHYDTSGCVYDDDGTPVTPYVAPGASLVWP
jgi:hypothetical protein